MTSAVAVAVAEVRTFSKGPAGLMPANFFLSIGVSLVAIVQSLSIFGLDREIRNREFNAGFNRGGYFFGKAIAALPHAAFIPFLFLLVYTCWFFMSSETKTKFAFKDLKK